MHSLPSSPNVTPAPDDSLSFLPLEVGLEHLRQRRFGEAITSLEAALQREAGRVPAVRGLATAHLLSGNPEAARRVLGQFTNDHAMTAEGWRLAAQLEWKLGDRQSAQDILRRGLQHLPSSTTLHRQMLLFLAASDKLQEAAAHLEPACQDATPASQRLQEFLAAAIGAWKRPMHVLDCDSTVEAAADADLLDAIAQEPRLLDALLRVPSDQCDRDMLLEVEWRLARQLKLQPHHADRQLLLARLQMKVGADDAAMLSLQRALRTNPNFVDAHRLRADLHVKMGEIEGAIEILNQLLKRKLAWPDIHYEIAALEQKRGRLTEARSHLYSAIRLNPTFEQAHKLLEQCVAA